MTNTNEISIVKPDLNVTIETFEKIKDIATYVATSDAFVKGQTEGAKLGKGGSFSYAGIYSAIQMNVPSISEASVKDMVAAGKGITRTTGTKEDPKEAFIALQKVTFKVEKLVQPNEVEGEPDLTEFEVSKGIFQTVYALTDMDVTAHTPRAEGEDDDETPGVE